MDNLTEYDFELLECVLISAIFDRQNRIAEIKRGGLEEQNKRDQLAINEKSFSEYTTLLEKIRKMEEEYEKSNL